MDTNLYYTVKIDLIQLNDNDESKLTTTGTSSIIVYKIVKNIPLVLVELNTTGILTIEEELDYWLDNDEFYENDSTTYIFTKL